MFKQLIHKLKLKFGKKTKVATLSIISGVTHAATSEALNSCWGAVTIVDQRKPDNEARNECK